MDEKPDPRKLGQVTGRFARAATRCCSPTTCSRPSNSPFGVAANVATFLVRTVLGIDVDTTNTENNWWLVSYLTWALLYFWVSTAITGRTIGKRRRASGSSSGTGPRCEPARPSCVCSSSRSASPASGWASSAS